MDLNITNINIDGKDVYSVSWITTPDGYPLSNDMVFSSPINVSVDKYNPNNSGEGKVAIITVETNNGVIKNIEINRCAPDCTCNIFDISCKDNSAVKATGGSIKFEYKVKERFDIGCNTNYLDCQSDSSFVTINKMYTSSAFTATFSSNDGEPRSAKIQFSYFGVVCKQFTISQGGKNEITPKPPGECDESIKITTDATGIMCEGETITFAADGGGGGGDTDFEILLSRFNDTLSRLNLRKISSVSTPKTYNYLESLYDEAVSTFNNNNSELFLKSSYAEIYDYRNGSITNHELGLSAMTSWLMAMQISEIVANSGVTTNNQTELFKTAYEIGGGRRTPLYGYSDLRSDVSICRLAASAIYGKNKSYYDFDKIDEMRTEIGTTVNDKSCFWTEYGYSTNGENHICDNTLSATIGYIIDFNSIFPAAAGPYATEISVGGETCSPSNPTAADRQPDPLQPSNQFNSSTNNYIVDETIDNIVTTNYNLYSVTNYLPRTIQAVADDSDSVTHSFASITYYKYNSSSPLNSFSAGTPSDNNGSFSGTFNSSVIGVDLSSLLIDEQGNETPLRDFYSGIRNLGGNSRRSLLNKQYGRRRPAQGTADNTPRCVCGNGIAGGCTNCADTSCTRQNWLGDDTLERLIGSGTKYDSNNNPQRYYIDSNGNGYWENGEPYYGQSTIGTTNLCPGMNVKAATYPSGHSAGAWTIGMFLMQMIPDYWLKIYKSAYAYAVSRTIVRAHWNSDTIYGKLCASAIVPTINSFNNSEGGINFRTLYNDAKNMIDNA